ncbi:hypothetical protein CDD81_4676 [Ophiocordyceps australis]|uniref:Uncharacterized protein n=1 Tax=Ophiocordyceps australis TaxID=1399860 RepID=A0A2C5XTH8_9HYPO|nr:hypothetical protein CDD81_4676 [Ophiocordyceps australis]
MDSRLSTALDATKQSDQDEPITNDQSQLKHALEQLKLLHTKERTLRDLIPRMIEPLIQRHPSPDMMFSAFVKAVTEAQAELKTFTDLMRSDDIKQILARAEKSRRENPDHISS